MGLQQVFCSFSWDNSKNKAIIIDKVTAKIQTVDSGGTHTFFFLWILFSFATLSSLQRERWNSLNSITLSRGNMMRRGTRCVYTWQDNWSFLCTGLCTITGCTQLCFSWNMESYNVQQNNNNILYYCQYLNTPINSLFLFKPTAV